MSKSKVPIVAIVGRANVGKSSLFNAVLQRREAIVADEPGTTRDSIMAKASIFTSKNAAESSKQKVESVKSRTDLDGAQGDSENRSEPYQEYGERESELSTPRSARNTGRVHGSAGKSAGMVRQDFWLVDTAGLKDAKDDFEFTIQEQIAQAADSADVIIVMVEAHIGITEEDRRVAKMALKTKKPVILIGNKADKVRGQDLDHLKKLGVKDIFATSVTQARGIEDLLEHMAEILPHASIREDDDRIRLSVLGRPNVGKSSLFNALAKKQQAIVADKAGTTRDINRSIIKYNNREIELLDTAGIRRSGRIERGVEKFSVIRAISAIEQSDVSLLLMDANELNVQLDQKIAGMIKEAGKGLILVVSKWDSVEDKDAYTRDAMAPKIAHNYAFVPWAPLILTSAVTGQNVTKIYDLVLDIVKKRETRIKTVSLNRWLRKVVDKHPPAGLKNRNPKLNYIVQEDDNPTPAFKVFGAQTKFLHWSYKRYMEREMRREYGFEGTPIQFWFIEKHVTHKHGQSPTKETE